ncbi:MAG: proline dehydrogenase family protein [Gemmatimonadota bacterium]|nr:proline dehydrogenase family protein [Gemmatimonadota bacterium]MDH3368792.1 proline dehydrogenase family protein [Gemmatimonadota bacterium]MDH3476913.1 proline dehydrogenase family protein [Gemmatimonadota bacterium]MDH3568596.1 proline dehydrogenase family protein [Gemmatimonadota bacterium]MDH5548283.1 proline dehydrogenase family protein [Gemmatimonadota bacterium]
MLRSTFLWLSERRGVLDFVKRNGLARRVATRFVAGETLESAIEAGRVLNARNITVSLDLLGESVSSPEETRLARDAIIRTVDGVATAKLDGNVSVKLTQLGLDIDTALCAENMRAILDRARESRTFIRMDMEGSKHTEATLRLFYDVLHPEYDGLTGVVIQSYMRRSAKDIDDLVGAKARVRLCKGAYAEPPDVAFQERADVRASFSRLMRKLLEHGDYPGIATHDEVLIGETVAFAKERGVGADRFEFQMLYGVRRDLQESLRWQGYNMRVYVPFGTHWYPYLMRRLAERPANVGFMVGSIAKEAFGRR